MSKIKKMLEEKINIDLPAKINQYSEKLENTRMDALHRPKNMRMKTFQ